MKRVADNSYGVSLLSTGFMLVIALAFNTPARAQTPADNDIPPAYWELIGGYEWDTHDTGFVMFGPGYVHSINDNVAWQARLFGNYLYYSFEDFGGEREVRSPGLAPSVGLKFGRKNFFSVTAGPEVKWRKERFPRRGILPAFEERKTRWGGAFGAEAYAGSRTNVHALVNYSTIDQYTWGRLGIKQQVNNFSWQDSVTTYVGVEGIGQGNEDIRSAQVGGLVEVLFVPSSVSLMFRVGYKSSTFDFSPRRTGPYFAIGYYQRLSR